MENELTEIDAIASKLVVYAVEVSMKVLKQLIHQMNVRVSKSPLGAKFSDPHKIVPSIQNFSRQYIVK